MDDETVSHCDECGADNPEGFFIGGLWHKEGCYLYGYWSPADEKGNPKGLSFFYRMGYNEKRDSPSPS